MKHSEVQCGAGKGTQIMGHSGARILPRPVWQGHCPQAAVGGSQQTEQY